MIAWMLGCTGGLPSKDPGTLPTDPDPTLDTTPGTTPPEELCNGADDDGDGRVDESYDDFDADGIADCVDDACDPDTVPVEVVVNPCQPWWTAGVQSTIPLAVWPNLGTVIGLLEDHDGDGVLTPADGADIVVPGQLELTAYDAVTGAVDLVVPGNWFPNGGALLNVDGDGFPEILGVQQVLPSAKFVVSAVDRFGDVVWSSPELETGNVTYGDMCTITGADLDGDGTLEVLCDSSVLDGATGQVEATLTIQFPPFGTELVADLDQDGLAEILLNGRVLDATGALIWGSGIDTTYSYANDPTNHPAVAQLDADAEAEVLWVNDGVVYAFEHDGTLIGNWVTGLTGGGPPCVADFDGDGAQEVVVGFDAETWMFEADGSVGWTWGVGTGYDGCSAFDLDDDGAAEVLVSAVGRFAILDGATGAQRYADTTFVGGYWLYPMPVDLDGDGHTEIVVANRDAKELTVYGQIERRWAGSGPGWATHDFTEGRVDELGGAHLPASWLDVGFRARATTGPPEGTELPGYDLAVAVTGACAASCDAGPQSFVIQVSNVGDLVAPAGLPLAVYSVAGAQEVLVHDEVLPELASGASVESTVTLDPSDLPGHLEVRLDSATEECDTTNDQVVVEDVICP